MNERDDPEAAVNEAEALVSGKLREEDRQIRVQIPFRVAFQIALHLDVPRLAREVGKERQALIPIEEIWGWAADPNDPLDNPDTLLEQPVTGQIDNSPSIQGPPFKESLLWVLADKFPSFSQLANDTDELRIRYRSDETYELSLSRREVETLGHSILQTVYKEVEDFPRLPDNPDFWDIEREKFGRNFRFSNSRLIRAYNSLYRAFIEAGGGMADMRLQGELERLLKNLS